MRIDAKPHAAIAQLILGGDLLEVASRRDH